MLFRITLILTTVLFLAQPGLGQKYNFKNFTSEDGLQNDNILGITQMPNGEMWFGSNDGGINIFDGINFRALTKSEGLSDNVVFSTVKSADEKGYWISTNHGLTYFDGHECDTLIQIDSALSTQMFYTTFVDSKKQTWFCTASGLAKLEEGKVTSYKSQNDELNATRVTNMVEDKEGNLWISTVGASVFIVHLDQSVEHIKHKKDLTYTWDIFFPDDNRVWFMTYKGLYEKNSEGIKKITFLNAIHKAGLSSHKFGYYDCTLDTHGHIWIATDKGVIRQKGVDTTLFTERQGLVSGKIWSVFEDREKNIWISSREHGISKIHSTTFDLLDESFGLPDKDVQAILVDSRGDSWIGTNRGILKISSGKQEIIDLGNISSSGRQITSFAEHKDGTIYACSKKGLINLSKETPELLEMHHDNYQFKSYSILVDGDNILLGGVQGLGMIRNNEIVLINDSLSFPEILVLDILKSSNGTYWFATENGVMSYDGISTTRYTESQGIPQNKARSIVEGEDGTLYIGTSEGLYLYQNNTFKHVDGLYDLGEQAIYGLIFDFEDNLWIARNDGLDKVKIENGNITSHRHYDESKGFMAQNCHNNAIGLTASGRIILGTDQGLLTYYKEEDFINDVESLIQFTDVQLFSQPTDWNQYADSVDFNGFPVDVVLNHNQNYFTFKFIGINHTNPNLVRYEYKLEGWDKDWIQNSKKREEVYSNLDPGRYSFKVRASNGEEVWNELPATISFRIRPPFWQTWWFYSICFLLFVMAVYSYLKIRASNIKIRSSNHRITMQNKIIEEKNHEIFDSINYAKRIQEAILPDKDLKTNLPECFVFYKPKDIVSGDFYWYRKVGSLSLLAAVDCTGHGVPGGFVSMVGYSGLNRAVNEYDLTDPGEILEKLSEFVVSSFNAESEDGIKDGMDVSLVALDTETGVLKFAGANNPLYVVKKEEKPLRDPEDNILVTKNLDTLHEIKGARRPVGSFNADIAFKTHTIQLEPGDHVYLFTDGFPDQFGGEKGKKFLYKNFKKLLMSFNNDSLGNQKKRLDNRLEEWRGDNEQVDDICIIGVKYVG